MKKHRKNKRSNWDHNAAAYNTYYIQSGASKKKVISLLEKMIAFFFKVGIYRY